MLGLGRLRLKRLSRGLEPSPRRRFDPAGALQGPLDDASRAFLREAIHWGTSGQLWAVWRQIQRELGRAPADFIRELPSEGRRRFGLWALEHGDREEGIAAYQAFAREPGHQAVLAEENLLALEALLEGERLDEAVRFVDALAEDGAEAPREQCHLALALLDAGHPGVAAARLGSARGRYHDCGELWATTALALRACGREGEAQRAAVEAAKVGVADPVVLRRLLGQVPVARWRELCERYAYRPATFEEQQADWAAHPGADLVPAPEGAPHRFGGEGWQLPSCRGCGHPVRAWFTLDLAAAGPLAGLLPGWGPFPLLGCADCLVSLGRHDYAVDPARRAVLLENVAISTRRYGRACGTTEPLPARPAALAWRAPVARTAGELPEPPRAPQVGGVPSWTQGPLRVFCPCCRREMAFVAAMASTGAFGPPVAINNESGFQYHFACGACRRLSVIAQWT